ncbi:MAG: hypothetical protein HY692_01695 [Cyanobacteria bacterium NC_groundwater_1444_Ag_S-0.65um_54_12]|nr:hypothetical protein [Cyanobacteria bacterium NC_groundwater_1444_Ag_S-0.65um_54_12]
MERVPPPPRLAGTFFPPPLVLPPDELTPPPVAATLTDQFALPDPLRNLSENVTSAAKDFAGILFGYMFSEMRPKSEEDSLLGGGDTELFMDFFDQALGRQFADGAASQIIEALLRQLGEQKR